LTDGVEQRRLSGAVLADDAGDPTGESLDRDGIER
jgi:hypothetical protein